jgi:cephalosporin-C deacetylase-like acetyl esterase
MIRSVANLSVLFLVCSACCVWAADVSVVTDREDALYSIGEQAGFVVKSDTPVECKLTFTLDGADELKVSTLSLKDEPQTAYASLLEPGFLRCSLEYTDPETSKQKRAVAAAGFEPEKIEPGSDKLPDEFDLFWNEMKRQLGCIPFDTVMEPHSSENGIEIFDIKVDCIGKNVSGYYARPTEAKKGSCPAILFVQGAGVYSSRTGSVSDYAGSGFIALEINAHGLPNGQDADFYSALAKGELQGYPHWGRESRYTSYFKGMYLRVVRALEFLKSQPEWDGKVLVSFGSSQGGAQALAAAGLDRDVNIVMAAVPAMSDHNGKIAGWPRMVPVESDGSRDEQIANASVFFDNVNFVRKSNAYGVFTVGFIDNVCRPTSVYAVYNTFPGEKEITNEPLMDHKFLDKHREHAKETILKLVKDIKSK